MEKPNLLWETIRFYPKIIFTLEPTSKSLRSSLSHDMSHFHFFMESEFGDTDVRDSDFTSCKTLLQSHLNESGLLFYLTQDYNDMPTFKSFDCNRNQVKVYNVPELTKLYA